MTDETTTPVRFGRYTIEGLLGNGGMARVYQATLAGPEGFAKEVALKIAYPNSGDSEASVKRSLTNEARIGSLLRHKHMVEMYDFGEVDGQYYIAMEYVRGWPLDELIEHCRMHAHSIPVTVVLELLTGIANGLKYFHDVKDREGNSLNPVHRDLKPGNVMVGPDGTIKIMDFGIVSADFNRYKTTLAGTTKGTPTHMAPEQVAGGNLDHRTDLFAFGCIVYELVMMEKLFWAKTIDALMMKVMRTNVTAERGRLNETAPEFTFIFDRCVKKDPKDRFYNTSDLVAALGRLREGADDGPSLEEWISNLDPRMPINSPQPITSVERMVDTVAVDANTELPDSVDADEWVMAEGFNLSIVGTDVPSTSTALGEIRGELTADSGIHPVRASRFMRRAWIVALIGFSTLLLGIVVYPLSKAPTQIEIDPDTDAPTTLGLESLTVEAEQLPSVAATPPTAAPMPRVEHESPTPKAVASKAKGHLGLNARPPAQLEIDGRSAGMTPKLNVELYVGTHSIVFICESGKRVTKSATISEGSNPTIFVRCN